MAKLTHKEISKEQSDFQTSLKAICEKGDIQVFSEIAVTTLFRKNIENNFFIVIKTVIDKLPSVKENSEEKNYKNIIKTAMLVTPDFGFLTEINSPYYGILHHKLFDFVEKYEAFYKMFDKKNVIIDSFPKLNITEILKLIDEKAKKDIKAIFAEIYSELSDSQSLQTASSDSNTSKESLDTSDEVFDVEKAKEIANSQEKIQAIEEMFRKQNLGSNDKSNNNNNSKGFEFGK